MRITQQIETEEFSCEENLLTTVRGVAAKITQTSGDTETSNMFYYQLEYLAHRI
jgi:hypothetical protein